jgi:hypothetical protein
MVRASKPVSIVMGRASAAIAKARGSGCAYFARAGEKPHPDSFFKKERAKVPEPIRKYVELIFRPTC